MVSLNQVPIDENKDLILESTSECGTNKVVVRKEGEKDVWIEVWSSKLNGGLVQSCKLSTECTKVYNDAVFGSVTWSKDQSKIAFVGEVPAVATFKNPWDLPAPTKDDAKPAEKKDEHWLEDKYVYEEEFGELLVGKKTAGLFVYDIKENKVSRVHGIPENVWPQYPVFDQHS